MITDNAESLARREISGAVGASTATAATGARAAPAKAAGERSDVKKAASLTIIDFHNHFVGPKFPMTVLAAAPPALRSHWEGVSRNLASPDALLSSIDDGGIAARVINTPTAFLQDAEGNVAPGTIPRINDAVAELVHKHPGRLYGLATVDVYAGEPAARELTRAVNELGLRGVFVESAKGDLLPDAPQARAVFATAAALGVPVFLHPVTDLPMHNRFKKYGRLGVRLARSTINSAAMFAMMESGLFEELPGLRVVVTTLSARRGVAGRRLRRRLAAAQGHPGGEPPPDLHRHHGNSPGNGARCRRPLGGRPCSIRHRLADRGGDIDAATVAGGT
jgi:predicted TIM-barrel fold metal-dependent hydrolase